MLKAAGKRATFTSARLWTGICPCCYTAPRRAIPSLLMFRNEALHRKHQGVDGPYPNSWSDQREFQDFAPRAELGRDSYARRPR
jgi:hypothetical protein